MPEWHKITSKIYNCIIKVQLDLKKEACNTIVAHLSQHCLRVSHVCGLQKLPCDPNSELKKVTWI